MTPEYSSVPDYAAMLRLDGRGFLLLGAGEGIARQTAHALHQAGASVFCVDRDREVAERTAREVNGFSGVGDVTQRADMERLITQAREALPHFSGIVDIVGIAQIAPLASIDDEFYQRQHDIVFRHAFLSVQLGAPALAEGGGGAIVFVGSLIGVMPTTSPDTALYGAAKAALHHFARWAAFTYGPQGVRINTVAPGVTMTPRVTRMMGDKVDRLAQANPLRRVGQTSDVASAILFFVSDMARHVTGQTLVIDGGTSAALKGALET